MTIRLPRRLLTLNVFLVWVLTLSLRAHPEPISLERAIRLALVHSTTSAVAGADLQRSYAAYREIRNNYIPQLMVGSGLGYTFGFPLTLEGAAPAVVSVVSQSTIFNPAQKQFMKAAKTEWQASQFQDKDQRNAVIEDVSLSYAELAKWEARLEHLQQDESMAADFEKAVTQRVQEGVDSVVDLGKAKLVTARTRLHMAEARGSADVLRRHLAVLTALPVSSFEITPQTIPALPTVSPDDDLSAKAVSSSPAIQLADQHALAETMRASGEHRAMLPSVDFSMQYARLSKINNYDQFYLNYQPNNFTVGGAIRFPIFNASQRERAKGADADALKARKQAEATRNQVSEETLKLQHAAEQLAAAREIAQLEYQLTLASVEAAQTRIDAGTGTMHELADVRIQASERYLQFQDADFEYQRARLSLLRATGDLEKWALPGSPSQP